MRLLHYCRNPFSCDSRSRSTQTNTLHFKPPNHQPDFPVTTINMRSFTQLVVLFFALFAFAIAQESASYDATVYVTSTIYRVNTVTRSGTPTPVANSTSALPTTISVPSSAGGSTNGTLAPTRTPSGTPTPSPFPGAASQLNANFALAALAAVAGFMIL